MPDYRRWLFPGGTFFFTVVSFNRLPIFTTEPARHVLHDAWKDVEKRFPFTTVAICLLPDHLHCIWTLPDGDGRTSIRWKEIKRLFTKSYLEVVGPGSDRNTSRLKRGEAAIWQRRFWEHVIINEVDLNHHLDYIHYNPVKHGLVEKPVDWPWSSFHRYVQEGYYPPDWGTSPVSSKEEYGE
jgi:putative transposase